MKSTQYFLSEVFFTIKDICYQFCNKLIVLIQLIAKIEPIYLLSLVILLIFINVLLTYLLLQEREKPSSRHVFKQLMEKLPLKMCYWQKNGRDFFINEEVPVIVKSTLYGYGLIQFILNYNQDIQEQFTKLENNHINHFQIFLTGLAAEIFVYKNDEYFFMLVNKIDKQMESLLLNALNDMTGNMTWIETEGTITYKNKLADKYKAIIPTLPNIESGRQVISIDNNLYKYNRYGNHSYIIHMLNEINEFKDFYKDEKNKKLIYNFLSFLKEKFVILTREGKIIFLSEGLKSILDIDNSKKIYDISDLINIINKTLHLPEETNFQNYIDNMRNKIFYCENIESEYFSSLDDKVFSRTIFPSQQHVMIVFEDISKQIASEKEYIKNKNLQSLYWNSLEEGVIIFDASDKLISHNTSLLNFVKEKNINNKNTFKNNLQKSSNEENVYIAAGNDGIDQFTLIENKSENLQVYILKSYKKNKDNSLYSFDVILNEVNTQWRYLEYIKQSSANIKTLEQINFVFKSLNKLKLHVYSYLDYYNSPSKLTSKRINIIDNIKNFLSHMSHVYNLKNLNISYKIDEYYISTDEDILNRIIAYFLEFFYSFYFTNNKIITIDEQNQVLIISLYIDQKIDFTNINNTKLIYVTQKLLKILGFSISISDEKNSFQMDIYYDNSISE